MKKRGYIKYLLIASLACVTQPSQAQFLEILKALVEKIGAEVVFERRKSKINEIIGFGDKGLEGLQKKNRETTKQYQQMYDAVNTINSAVRGLQEVKEILIIGKNTAGLTADTLRRLRSDESLTTAQKTALVIQLVQLQNNNLDMMTRRYRDLLDSYSGNARLKMNDSDRIRQLAALRDEMNEYYRATVYLRQKSAHMGAVNRHAQQSKQMAMDLLYLH